MISFAGYHSEVTASRYIRGKDFIS